MQLSPAVTLLKMDEFNDLDENTVIYLFYLFFFFGGGVFSTSRQCIQLKLSQVTCIVSLSTIWPIKTVTKTKKGTFPQCHQILLKMALMKLCKLLFSTTITVCIFFIRLFISILINILYFYIS